MSLYFINLEQKWVRIKRVRAIKSFRFFTYWNIKCLEEKMYYG